MSAKIRDLLGSVLMLIFVAVLWVQRDYMTPFGGIFPDIVMICLAAMVVLTIVMAFTPWRAMKDEKEEKKAVASFQWFDLLVVAIVLLIWSGFLRYMGFAVAGILGFGGISWFLSEDRGSWRNILLSTVIAVALTFLLIFVFEHLLKVPLPAGKWFE
ncbi:MAG: tripartite tricarboxylate transporter TctB family protein [Desulfuromonadales bacterium]|nr:tripartite tricarboxylate transporter TctB family protein [Desulfuromonadales bacterium]MDW7758768.1 tripartite tricarboxylate transporter TctB family protein [Desulfuromonadales bacterium]